MKTDDSIFNECVSKLARNNYAVMDHFLSPKDTMDILIGLKHKFEQGKFKEAAIGASSHTVVNKSIRGDLIHWVDPTETYAIMHKFIHHIEDFMKYLNRFLYLNLKDFEMHYALYPVGSSYKRHLDQLKDKDSRVLTFIYYLNFEWKESDGGALRLYLDGEGSEKPVDIYPHAGRLICFKSNVLEHEVLPTQRMRYSLTGWLLNKHKSINFI